MNEEEARQLKEEIALLRNIIFQLIKSDRYTFQKNIQMLDGRNIQLATGTGTKIGTAGGSTGQKLGFFNATPVVQQTGVAVSAAGIHAALVNFGLITA